MKIYGVNIAEGSTVTNLVVASGPTFPELASEGELFYRNDGANEGMYVYDGEEWVQLGTTSGTPAGSLISEIAGDLTGTVEIGTTSTLFLTPVGTSGTFVTVTTDETGRIISGTSSQAWSSITSTPTTLSGYGITDAQAADADLTAIAGLAGTSGLLKKTAADTWSLDTSTYLTGNQTVTVSGDATGSGSTSIALTLANSGAAAGTYTKVTIDAKGRVTTATTLSAGDIPSLSSTYQPLDADLTAIAGLAGTSGALKKTAANTWSLDTSAYLTGNQTVTVNGDATGSGTTSISLTLANSGVTAGTYGTASAVPTVTVDAKGRLTSATSTNIAIAASQITSGTLSDSAVASSNVTQHQAALTIAETQITDGSLLARVGSSETISGTWTFSNPVTVATPTSGSHAATKDYVDNTITGLDMKASVRVATTANITLSGTQTIDGVAVVAGDRVLVKDQTSAIQNGIYVVAVGAWARASDADNTPAGEVTSGMYTFVEEGTTNADSGWVLSTNNPITLGNTALTYVQFNGLGQVTAGAGLTKTGNTMNVVAASANRVVVNTDSIDLATTGTAGTYTKVTTDAYGRVVSGGALSAGDIPSLSSTYQPLDADLTAIAGLAGTSGILAKTAADTWALDTSTYLTGNQSITVSGDATGSGSTAISLTLANSGVAAGTFTKVTVDAKGRVTTATTLAAGDIPSLTQYVLKTGDTMTGALTGTNFHASAGSAAAPSISFSADTNTGIYRPSEDTIAFVEGGTEAMRITSSTYVGIGTSAPVAKFQVDLGAEGEYMRVGGDNAAGGRALRFSSTQSGVSPGALHTINAASGEGQIALATAGVERMRIDSSGNVAIGTTTATQRLTVSGGRGIYADGITWRANSDWAGLSMATSDLAGNPGNVGVYLSAPYSAGTANQAFFRVKRGAASLYNGAEIGFSTTFRFLGSTVEDTAERMRITATGNVGIGTSAPGYKLDVAGDTNIRGTFTATTASITRLTFSNNLLVTNFNSGTNASSSTFWRGDGIWSTLSVSDIPSLSSVYQPLDADLTAIAGLAGTSGALKKTAANTWSLDTSTYLTGNQTIDVSGDATGSGSTAIALTLANSGVVAGTYGSDSAVPTVTVDAKGRLTSATSTNIAIAASQITSGTLSDSVVASSNVTQHQAALTITESQITDGDLLARVSSSETISGTWTFSNPVTVGTPVSGSHAVTKDYVDNTITGLDMKASVRVATTANITLSGTQTIDGVAVIAGDRVLVKDQTTTAQNGIYVVAAGAWSRAADADNTPAGEVTSGMYAFVEEGTTNADSGWVLSTNNPITLGVTALSFVQFNGLGQVTAGTGLTKTGNTMNVVSASANRIVVNADNIDLATTGTAGTYTKVTTDAYGRITTATTLTAGDIPSLASTYVLKAGDTMTGTLTGTNFYAGAGTTSSPSISFSADTNTGIYNPAADTIAFVEGGVEAMRINSNGNVGIRNTAPEYKLDLAQSGSSTSTDSIRLDVYNGPPGGGGTAIGTGILWKPYFSGYTKRSAGIYQVAEGNFFRSGLAFYTNGTADTSTDFTEVMRISGGGNVGIGTSTFTHRLAVYGGDINLMQNATYIRSATTAGTSVRMLGINASDVAYVGPIDSGPVATFFSVGGSSVISAFYTGGTERMRIDANGNLGIGTSTVAAKLHVVGNISRFGPITSATSQLHLVNNNTDLSTTTSFIIGLDSGAAANFGSAYAGVIWHQQAYPILFATNNIERMRIDSSGNVGIGTKTPGYKLDVAGDMNVRGTFTATTASITRLTFSNNLLVTNFNSGTNASSSTFWRGDGIWSALSISDIPSLSSIYQPLDADLTAIAGLAGTSGLLKKTAANTWSLDTAAYLTGNQSITLSGDASGSGATAIAVTLANSGVAAGTYTKVTVDAKGRVTTATTLLAADIPSLSATYQPLDADLTAIGGLAGTSGILKKTAANTWSLDTGTYLTGNQTITLSGDATGSGSTTIALTLANSGVTAGTYGSATSVSSVTFDSKGRATSATSISIALDASQITSGALSDARVAASNVTQHQTSLTIAESQITDGALLARVGSSETISGTWTFNNPVTVGTPTLGSHATTKDYVDNAITGLDMKASVRVATTANITLSGTQTIDGVAVIAGNRVLVKNQTTTAQNGIYVVAAGAWSRATDADNTPAGEVTAGMYTFVEEGTTNADSGWVLSTNNPITLGTTGLTFVQFNGLGQITGGAGLTKTGNTLDIATASANRIVVNADSIDLATTGTAGTYTKVTTDAYGRVTTATTLVAADIPSLSSIYQPLDADLTAIAGLAGTSGLLKKTAADTWSLDTSTYLTSSSQSGSENPIINGKMEISQRGSTWAAITTGVYTLDRWRIGYVTSAVATVSQQTDVPSSNEFRNSLRVAVTTADASIATGDYFAIQHFVEGYNARYLIGQTFTLSFWVRSSTIGVHCINFSNSTADRSYVCEYSISVANTWERKTVTVTGGLITAGTWDWTIGRGVGMNFVLASGATFQTTANSWQIGNFIATSSQVNCLDTVGNIFAITGVQIDVGTEAMPFKHRPYGTELALCQRYFEKGGNAGNSIFSSDVTSGQNYYLGIAFSVTKRATPTISLTNLAASAFPSSVGAIESASVAGFREMRQATTNVGGGFFVSSWEASSEI